MGSLMGGLDVHQAQEVVREMLTHPATVTGLSDAGAHVTLICDASMPSTQLTYWTRDRRRGEQIPLEFLVAKQTSRNAALYGFADRGTLAPGLRADINVIDHERLTVAPPKAFHDLPAGGTPPDPAGAGLPGDDGERRSDPPPRRRHRRPPRPPRPQLIARPR